MSRAATQVPWLPDCPMRFAIFVILASLALPVHAQQAPTIDSAVFVERAGRAGSARVLRMDSETRLARGDRVVTILSWDSPQANGLKLTSAVPSSLQVQSASRDGLEISSDGGRSWRILADSDAIPAGVTHLRVPLGRRQGTLSYRAVVR